MIKVEVIKDFTLNAYEKIRNIKRKTVDSYGKLYTGDTFECDEDMVKYLTGNNEKGEIVVKVIEIEPIKLTHGDKIEENIKPLNKENVKKATKELEKHIKAEKKASKK